MALSAVVRRRLVCKYAGVSLQVAAQLEGIDPAELADARRSLGRATEDGNPGTAAPAPSRLGHDDIDRMMRSNRSVI